MGLAEAGAKCQPTGSRWQRMGTFLRGTVTRPTFTFPLQQCADVHDVISPSHGGEKEEKSQQKTTALFGRKLTVLVNTMPRSTAAPVSAATGHRCSLGTSGGPAGRLMGSLTTSGWESLAQAAAGFSSSEILRGPLQLASTSLPPPPALKAVTPPVP